MKPEGIFVTGLIVGIGIALIASFAVEIIPQLEIEEQTYSEGYEDCRTEAIAALDTLCRMENDSLLCFNCDKVKEEAGK